MYLFDSLSGDRSEAEANIRAYLSQEWEQKKVPFDFLEQSYMFSSTEMELIAPVVPQQPNWYDCGTFLLTYVEKIFERYTHFWLLFDLYYIPFFTCRPNIFIETTPVKELSTWFSLEEISQKRQHIRDMILEMSHQQNTDDVLLKNAITTGKVTNTPIKDKNYSVWLTKMNEADFHYFRSYSTIDYKDTPETTILGSPFNTSVSGKAKMTEAKVQETEEYGQCLKCCQKLKLILKFLSQNHKNQMMM